MNFAILGAGNIAVSMAQAVKGLRERGEEIAPYAVASRSQGRARTFAEQHGFEKAFGSYEEMLADPKVELVYVATPPACHFEQAWMCLNAGKAVLCEKPFTVNAKQARALCALAEEKNLLLAEAIWTRYMPSRTIISELADSGVVGKIRSLSANLGYPVSQVERLRSPELGGGALLDLSVYPLNFAHMVMRDCAEEFSASCTKLPTGVDAQDSITLRFPGDRMAVLFGSMLVQTDRCGVISGEDGFLLVQNINNPEEIRVYDWNCRCIRTVPVPKQINGYEYEVLSCKKAMEEGKCECPEMPHAETIRMMELMDAIRESWGLRYPME